MNRRTSDGFICAPPFENKRKCVRYICLTSPPAFYDCLLFRLSERFRLNSALQYATFWNSCSASCVNMCTIFEIGWASCDEHFRTHLYNNFNSITNKTTQPPKNNLSWFGYYFLRKSISIKIPREKKIIMRYNAFLKCVITPKGVMMQGDQTLFDKALLCLFGRWLYSHVS